MSTPRFLLDMEQGATFEYAFNWYAGGKFMAPIEDICVGYPTVIKVTAHGLPTISDTPVIISGVEGCEYLNSHDLGIEEGVYVDVDTFEMPQSTVKEKWIPGTGEITYHKPTDITDYTARMQIREKWHSTDVIHELTTENGGIILTIDDASILLTILPNITSTFKFNKAVYDVKMISPGGDVTRVFEGIVTLHKEVTE
jgi:hypothetical protein